MTMDKLISTKNEFPHPWWATLRRPNHNYLQLAKNWNLSTKVWQFFHQHSQPLFDVMQKQIKNLEFVQRVNFEFTDSLKNKGIK